MKLDDLKNKKIAILWFGIEGKSVFRFLKNHEVSDITIFEKNPKVFIWVDDDFLGETEIRGWENSFPSSGEFDLVIKSPWFSNYNENIISLGNVTTTQTQIFFDNYKGKVIAVSWTKWKSTTASLIYEVLNKSGLDVKLVWNIWKSVLDEIDFSKEYDYVVFELSSYQLDGLKFSSEISLLLNIYPDHLDWHHGFENYKQAKLNIFSNTKNKLINENLTSSYLCDDVLTFGKWWDFSYKDWKFYVQWKEVFDDNGIKLLWNHNMINISWVLWVCNSIWIGMGEVEDAVKKFVWLPHRLECVWNYNWIDFYDDAISTTPESTIAALDALWDGVETIFLWWTDRGYDYKELAEKIILLKIKNVVLFPDTGRQIKKLLHVPMNILEADSMEQAVAFAFKNTSSGKICLLSTAAPSYSLWKNFENKWNEFKKYIIL